MPAPAITVLKNNVPWGPFTRAQIDEGLARDDFTLRYLAHTTGLKEWLPLGEVLDYADRHPDARSALLPPVPEPRELPPLPAASPSINRPAPSPKPAAPPVPPVAPEPAPRVEEKPAIPLEPAPEPRREPQLIAA